MSVQPTAYLHTEVKKNSVLDGNRTPILSCPAQTPILSCPAQTAITDLTKQPSSVQYRNTGIGEPNIQSGCCREAKCLSSC